MQERASEREKSHRCSIDSSDRFPDFLSPILIPCQALTVAASVASFPGRCQAMLCRAVQRHWAYFHVTGMFVQAAGGISGNAALPRCHPPKIKACVVKVQRRRVVKKKKIR